MSPEDPFEVARQALGNAMIGGRPAKQAVDIIWPIAFEAGKAAARRDWFDGIVCFRYVDPSSGEVRHLHPFDVTVVRTSHPGDTPVTLP